MNNKAPIKISLDIIMTIIFLLLLDAHGTGLVFHEIAGLSILAFITTHLLLNWSWVKNVTKNLNKTKLKTKLMYGLNAALFLSIGIITITGIIISQVIFPSGSQGNQFLLISAHKWVSYACLGLFPIHIAFHWNYILASMRTMLSKHKVYKLGKAITVLGATALIIGVLSAQIMQGSNKSATKYTSSTTQSTVSSRNSTAQQTKDDQAFTTLEDTQPDGQTVSLTDFLDNMFCTACGKQCSLLSLKCGKGQSQLESAKLEYQNLYG